MAVALYGASPVISIGYADLGIEALFSGLYPRQYIVLSVSTQGRALSGVYSITRIESFSEISSS